MFSDWSDVCARFYEPELVHNVIYSEEEECYDDEEDSNGKCCRTTHSGQDKKK